MQDVMGLYNWIDIQQGLTTMKNWAESSKKERKKDHPTWHSECLSKILYSNSIGCPSSGDVSRPLNRV